MLKYTAMKYKVYGPLKAYDLIELPNTNILPGRLVNSPYTKRRDAFS